MMDERDPSEGGRVHPTLYKHDLDTFLIGIIEGKPVIYKN